MNKLLASVAAAAILVSSTAFAGPDIMNSNESAGGDTAATTEAAPAKGDTAPVSKKHGKHHAKKAAHKKAKKAAAGK